MESVVVVTRSINRKLFYYSSLTIHLPYKHLRLTNTTADGYIEKLLSLNYEWAINIDEDAFITDNVALLSLLCYCEDNGYDICGYPDGGVLSCRHNNPLVMNPFFNIIHIRSIKNKLESSTVNKGEQGFDFSEYMKHQPEFEKKAPMHLMKKKYDFNSSLTEPYYPIMLWINQNCNCLYLDADSHSDGLSSIAKNHNDRPILIHTWFSRNYGRDSTQTERINNVICEALHTYPPPSMPIQLKIMMYKDKIHQNITHYLSILNKLIKKCYSR